jgi:hypothetical protein
LNKWLGIKTAKVAKECDKKNIGVLSEALFQMTERFTNQLYNLFNEKELRSFFSPLNAKIKKRVKEIYRESEYENVVFDHFAGKKPGEKLLPKSISDWTDKVRKSTFNALTVR